MHTSSDLKTFSEKQTPNDSPTNWVTFEDTALNTLYKSCISKIKFDDSPVLKRVGNEFSQAKIVIKTIGNFSEIC